MRSQTPTSPPCWFGATTTPGQVAENVGAVAVLERLDGNDIERLRQIGVTSAR